MGFIIKIKMQATKTASGKTGMGAKTAPISSPRKVIGRPPLEIPRHQVTNDKTKGAPFARQQTRKLQTQEKQKKYGSDESGDEDHDLSRSTP